MSQVAHLYSLERIPGVQIVALAEPFDDLRAAVAGRFSIPRATADYRDLLSRADIDGFIISMPRRLQSLIVAEFLTSKRAVLSEKPMAMTLEEAETMVASAARADTPWTVGYMKRHDRGVQNFVNLLSALRAGGDFGPLLEVRMHDFCAVYGAPIPEHVRRDRARRFSYAEAALAPDFVPAAKRACYDYTLNVASHDINLLRLLFGDMLTVVSFEVHADGAQHAIFEADGVPVRLTVAPVDRGRWDQAIEAVFARGRVTAVLPSPLARMDSAVVQVVSSQGEREIRIDSVEQIWQFKAQMGAFIASIRSPGPQINSAADMLGDLKLITGLWRKADFR
jgi:predicted dehydrogenase